MGRGKGQSLGVKIKSVFTRSKEELTPEQKKEQRVHAMALQKSINFFTTDAHRDKSFDWHQFYKDIDPERRTDLVQSLTGVLTADYSPPGYREFVSPAPDAKDLPPTAPAILGIAGQSQSGKDVLSDEFATNYKGIKQMVFSDAILDEVNELLEEVGGGRRIGEGNKPLIHNRKLIQAFALAKINLDPLHWVKAVEKRVEKAQEEGARMVLVSGVRRYDDVEMLKRIGAEVWRVNRPGNPYKASHDIEKEIPYLEVDKEIQNDKEGDLDNLLQQGYSLLKN